MATRIQLRRGQSADWASANPTLSYGEVGIEIDTDKFRIGDGTTAWNSLPYYQDSATLLSTVLGGVSVSFDTLQKLSQAVIPLAGTSGQFLKKLSGTNYDVSWSTISLSNLSDINLAGLADKDKLIYDSATSKWIRLDEPRIFVQSTEPSSPVAGDLWIW
jgi:hypothetical protein